MDGGYCPAIELMEAAMVGRSFRIVTVKMPLVHETRAIACSGKHRCQRGVGGQQIGTAHVCGVATRINLYSTDTASGTLVVAYSSIARVLASHQCTARRT